MCQWKLRQDINETSRTSISSPKNLHPNQTLPTMSKNGESEKLKKAYLEFQNWNFYFPPFCAYEDAKNIKDLPITFQPNLGIFPLKDQRHSLIISFLRITKYYSFLYNFSHLASALKSISLGLFNQL